MGFYVCVHGRNEFDALLPDEGITCGLEELHHIGDDLATFVLYGEEIIILFFAKPF